MTLCYTCNIIRPARTSHCAECDNCTERFDHHCVWIGTCVGKRNYRYYIVFLFLVNFTAIIQIIISLIILTVSIKNLQVIQLLIQQDINKKETSLYKINLGLSIAVVIFDICFVLLFLGKLFIMHFLLACQECTFYENLKKKWKKYPYLSNPYNRRSVCKNLKYLFCRKLSKSNVEAINQLVNPLLKLGKNHILISN